MLLVDDDVLILEALSFALEEDYEVHAAATRAEAGQVLLGLASRPRVALIDLGLPPTPHLPGEGFTLIEELLAVDPRMKILVLSGQSTAANIQHALTIGAVDFVPKPTDGAVLRARVAHQLRLLEAEDAREREQGEPSFIGQSPAIVTLQVLIRQFADTPFAVLIEGESGVGKELVARRLHRDSQRRNAPFLTVNCAAFSAELVDAQLFGHAKGAFTGATASRAGFFEDAGQGTLFLDEIGELPQALQGKLLRVLESGEYYRLGETQARTAQARIIAATNRDLKDAVRRGVFRPDLYQRLSVLTLQVPPLRSRGDDCLLILEDLCRCYCPGEARFILDEAARARLARYEFPGNVRELRNIVIRLATKYPGRSVGVRELEAELECLSITAAPADDLDRLAEQCLRAPGFRLEAVLEEWERRYIHLALSLSHGNLSQAARLLGVNRTTLYSKMERLQGSAD